METTKCQGVKVLIPSRHKDKRGFFSESWNKKKMDAAGLHYDFVQDNHSFSSLKGTIRGLHFQASPRAQAKLVRCGRGRLFDVAVDIRKGSPTFGKWTGIELSYENGKQLLIPTGFLHGFMTLEPDTEIIYKCSDYYARDFDGAVRWDSCGIEWPHVGVEPMLSEKDQTATLFEDFASPFTWNGNI